MIAQKDDLITRSDELKQDTPKSFLSRRLFLTAGSAVAAALAMPGAAIAQDSSTEGTRSESSTKPSCYVPFSEPKSVYSQDRKAKLKLNVLQGAVTLKRNEAVGFEDVPTRSYNGQIPGPTIVVNPGDKIKILLKNWLPPNDDKECIPNCPNCFNTTNLHFHGLHVSPSSICKNGQNVLSSDDVLFELPPAPTSEERPTRHRFCVWLPKFHAPGTHWYHAHRHGSTAIQVSNGMVGAIIVKDKPQDKIVEDSEDKVWILQEVVGTNDVDVYCRGSGAGPGGGSPFPGEFLVNGKLRPTITVQQGKIQRWRFINATATPRGLMNLKLCKADEACDTSTTCNNTAVMYLIAVDGISFYGKAPQPVSQDGWNMGPGNRADFLIKLTEPGLYKVIKDQFVGNGANASAVSKQVLAYVQVRASGFNEPLLKVIPGTPPDYLKPIQPSEIINPDKPREINFSINPPRGGGKFLINNQLYDSKCVNVEVALGTAEVWQLKTSSGSAHAFHIHVNPFQLVGDKIEPNGPDDPSNWRWWDTISVEPGADNTLTIWNRFLDYSGEFVFHCHLLTHEDQGMMQNVRVKSTPNHRGIGPCCSAPIPGIQGKCKIPFGGTTCPPSGGSCPTPPSEPEEAPNCEKKCEETTNT